MTLATLSIDLVAKLAEMQAGMDKATRIAERSAQQIEQRWQKAGAVLRQVGGALVAGISVAGLTAFVRQTVDGIDRLNDFAAATGATVENLSALEDVAARVGGSMDDAGAAVVKLNQALINATPGSAVEKALQGIGLSVEELRRADPAEALRLLSVALQQVGDAGQRARTTQTLFGEDVARLAPLLQALAREGQLVATVTTEQARAAREFNQQLAEFTKNATDAARLIIGPVIGSLNQLSAAINGDVVGGFERLSRIIVVPVQALSELFLDVKFVLTGIGTEIGGIAAQAAAVARLDFTGARTIGEEMRRDAEAARKEYDALVARIRSIGTVLPTASYSNEGRNAVRAVQVPGIENPPALPRVATRGESVKPPEPVVVPIDAVTQAALDRLANTDSQRIAALRLELQALLELRSDSGAGSVDEAILGIEEELARLDPALRAAGDAKARLDALLANTPTAQLGGVIADVEFLNQQFQAGAIGVEQWAEAIRGVTARLPSDIEQANGAMQQFQQTFSSALENALVGGGKLSDVFKGLAEDIARLAIRQTITGPLLQSFQSGGFGGFLNLIGSFFGGARANGGPVYPNRAYLVGERGPELVVPRSAGTVVPNNALGGQFTYAPTINVNGDVSPQTIAAMRAEIARDRMRWMRQVSVQGAT